jgi:hypothetical protein
VVRCRGSVRQTRFDTHDGTCEQCGETLVAACASCGMFKSYSHLGRHEKTCKVRERPAAAPLCVLGLGLGTQRGGQSKRPFALRHVDSFGTVCQLACPRSTDYVCTRCAMQGLEWMDTDDALVAHIARDTEHFALTKVYHTWYKWKRH